MRSITIAGRKITEAGDAWVVAEVGGNHGGDLKTALELCVAAKDAGCDAVKFQKRTIHRLYTKSFLDKSYNSEHSFGPTYGSHRAELEFGLEEYKVIADACEAMGLTWFATAWDETAADFLEDLDVQVYKIASGDLVNLPLIQYVARKGKPVILSTGGGTMDMIDEADHVLTEEGADAALLHCVAEYPTRAVKANLRAIESMGRRYPWRTIGYSCHYNGISVTTESYLYGARIIEKHFTLDHTLKGSDHALSLQPEGMRRLVRDLKRAREAQGTGEKKRSPEENEALKKMEKCLYPTRTLQAGHVLECEDVAAKSPAYDDGLRPNKRILGRRLARECSTSVPFSEEMLE